MSPNNASDWEAGMVKEELDNDNSDNTNSTWMGTFFSVTACIAWATFSTFPWQMDGGRKGRNPQSTVTWLGI